jgi:hypothetical protein
LASADIAGVKAFLQYTLWSTVVSSVIFAFTLYKNEPQRRLVFAVVKFAKSKLEGHPDPTEVLKVLSELQGSIFQPSTDGNETPMDVTEVPDAPADAPTGAPKDAATNSLVDAAKRMISSEPTKENERNDRDHYVQIDGKYYRESYNHVYIINGKRVFFEDQLHRAPGGKLQADLDSAAATQLPKANSIVTVSTKPIARPVAKAPEASPSAGAAVSGQPNMSPDEMLKTLERAKASDDAQKAYLNDLMSDK